MRRESKKGGWHIVVVLSTKSSWGALSLIRGVVILEFESQFDSQAATPPDRGLLAGDAGKVASNHSLDHNQRAVIGINIQAKPTATCCKLWPSVSLSSFKLLALARSLSSIVKFFNSLSQRDMRKKRWSVLSPGVW